MMQQQYFSLPRLSTKQTNTITRNQEHPVSHWASVRLVGASPRPTNNKEEEAETGERTEGGCSKNTRLKLCAR